MYSIVDTPDVITQEWLDLAFEPLTHYLSREYSEEKERILLMMMFMCNVEGRFEYKNRWTRSYIIFNQLGELISCAKNALFYEGLID